MIFKASESLAEQIANHLSEQIIRNDLKPGDRIQEMKVSKELEVSRGSVREAFLILQRWHMIDILPRRGAVVTDLNPERIDQLYELLTPLYIMIVSKVALKWQADDLKPFLDLFDRMREMVARQDIEEFFKAGFELPHMCFPLINNIYLEETIENFRPLVQRTYYLVVSAGKTELEESERFFNTAVQGVISRDVPLLEKTFREYAQHTLLLVQALTEKQRLAI